MSEPETAKVATKAFLPDGWILAEFDETCKPISDGGRKVPQKAYLQSGRYPIVDQGEKLIGGFTDDSSMLFQGERPVIAFGDHTRRFKLIDWPFVLGADGVKLIGPTGAWDAKCLWYFLRALKFENRGYSRHFQFLRKAMLPLPPLPEQERIADALDELLSDLDDGVAALERVREKLKLYRASVLKAAVEGALTAEWRSQNPHTEPASELLKRILAERRRRWEENEIAKFKERGKEPPKNWKAKYKEPVAPNTTNLSVLSEGWCWATIEQLTSGLMNGYGKRSQLEGRPLIVLRLADIANGDISYDDVRKINCTEDEVNQYTLKENDLLIIRVNGSPDLVGRIVLVRKTTEQALFCDHFIRARTVVPSLGGWLRVYADTQRFRRLVDLKKVSTAGQNTINQGALLPFAIPMPSLAEQEAVVEAVEDQFSIIDHLEADLNTKLKSAWALQQSILGHAFSGQLVPQNPADEPASELLKRIATEREQHGQAAGSKRASNKPSKPRAARKPRMVLKINQRET